MSFQPNPSLPVFDPATAPMPAEMVGRRIVYTNSSENPYRPLHGRVFTEYLLTRLAEFDSLQFIIEGEPAGSPFCQLARAGEQFMVDVRRIREHEMWTVGRAGEPSSPCVQLPAPWLTAGVIPVYERNIFSREVAASVVWAWMSHARLPEGLAREPAILGPHRQVS